MYNFAHKFKVITINLNNFDSRVPAYKLTLTETKHINNIFVKTIDYMNAEKQQVLCRSTSYNWPRKIFITV